MIRRILLPLLLLLPSLLRAQTDTTDNPLRRPVPSDSTAMTPMPQDSLMPMVQQSAISSQDESSSLLPVHTPRNTRLGFYGGADYSFQEAALNFSGPSGRPSGGNCRCQFRQGEGFGFVVGMSLSVGINDDKWGQTTRITYASHSARATSAETTLVFHPGKTEPDEEISTERFDLNLSALNAEILFSRLIGTSGLYITAGPSMGYILSSSYVVTLSVAEVEYKPSAGKLENVAKLYTSVLGGIGMRLRLGASGTIVQPEILYSYPLDDISRKYQWNVNSLRAAVTLLMKL